MMGKLKKRLGLNAGSFLFLSDNLFKNKDSRDENIPYYGKTINQIGDDNYGKD